MNHSASLTPDRSTVPLDPDGDEYPADFVAGYDLGYRHCLLDVLALPANQRATLLHQVTTPKE